MNANLSSLGTANCGLNTPFVPSTESRYILELDQQDILYTQSQCPDGEILLPHNFEVDTRPCPDSFHCVQNKTVVEDIRRQIRKPLH